MDTVKIDTGYLTRAEQSYSEHLRDLAKRIRKVIGEYEYVGRGHWLSDQELCIVLGLDDDDHDEVRLAREQEGIPSKSQRIQAEVDKQMRLC